MFFALAGDLFLARVGNAVILPFEKQGVWWHEKVRIKQHFYASQGGLIRKEREPVFRFTKNYSFSTLESVEFTAALDAPLLDIGESSSYLK